MDVTLRTHFHHKNIHPALGKMSLYYSIYMGVFFLFFFFFLNFNMVQYAVVPALTK